MVCAVGYTIMVKKLSLRYPAVFLAAFQAFIGSLFFLPILFLPSTTWPTAFEPTPVLAIIYLGLFVTAGAYTCYNYGVSQIPASQASAFINLIPVFTLIMAWLILDETLTGYQYVACGLIFAGVYLSQHTKHRRTPHPSTET